MAKATHSGTCQVCGRLQKLPGGVLSAHGYEVSKWGFFNGVCWGAGSLPFEQSYDLIERAINQQQIRVEEINRDIAELRSALDNTAPFNRYVSSFSGSKSGYQEQTVTLVERDIESYGRTNRHVVLVYADGKEEPAFRYSLHGTIPEIVQKLRSSRVMRYQAVAVERMAYIKWQQNRISNWKPGKLTPVQKGKAV